MNPEYSLFLTVKSTLEVLIERAERDGRPDIADWLRAYLNTEIKD